VNPLSPEAEELLSLVRAYLRDEMTYSTLWERYNAAYQTYDNRNEAEFLLLDGIWADLEVTTPIRSLIDDYPTQYLDEDELLVILRRKLAAVDAA
jgi:hypothetical protein